MKQKTKMNLLNICLKYLFTHKLDFLNTLTEKDLPVSLYKTIKDIQDCTLIDREILLWRLKLNHELFLFPSKILSLYRDDKEVLIEFFKYDQYCIRFYFNQMTDRLKKDPDFKKFQIKSNSEELQDLNDAIFAHVINNFNALQYASNLLNDNHIVSNNIRAPYENILYYSKNV